MGDQGGGPDRQTGRILDAIEQPSDAEILGYLLHNGPATSAELIEETDLTQPTVYSRMSALRETDAILQFEMSTSSRGRNPAMYDVADTESRTEREGDIQAPPETEGLPPSAKFVATLLIHNQPVTQKELVEASNMSQRTVRDALSRLDPYLQEEPNFSDARQSLYRYDPTSADSSSEPNSGGVSVPRRPGELSAE